MPQKKVPMRMCVGCRTMREKRELIRIVLPPEDDGTGITVDFRGKMNGRGAYLCRDCGCLSKAQKNKGLERALAHGIPPEVYEELSRQLNMGGGSI